jgi:hypothetical protein
MDMRFLMRNVRSLYRTGSFMTVAKKYQNKLDLVVVKEVGWGGSGTETADEYTLFYAQGN